MCFARRALARTSAACLVHVWSVAISTAQPPLRLPPVAPSAALVTIDEAVREAINHNLTLAAERYGVSVAQARILAARLRPNPVFTYNAMLPDRFIYENNVNPLEHVVRTDVIFEGGGKRERRIDVAEQARSVAELQLLNTMRTIALDVQSAFVDVVLATSNLAVARESLDAFNALVQVNTVRVRTGDLSQVELARSRLAALQFQNDVRQQAAKLVIAQNRLKMLVGRNGPEPIDATGDLRRDLQPVDLDAMRRSALARRPDVEAQRRDQARSTAEVRLQIAQGKADYTISGEFHRQRAPHEITGNQYGLYVSAPIPVFNRNQGEIERARQEQQQIAARIRALEAEVINEVQAAYEEYAASRDVVQSIETQMLAQARDVRATTEYSYRRGEASFVEFLDAVRAFNDTMLSYNGARAEFARSLYALDAISGASLDALPLKVTP
jgi:cobalt-zinc-cadmium efflux system outer membrane protein